MEPAEPDFTYSAQTQALTGFFESGLCCFGKRFWPEAHTLMSKNRVPHRKQYIDGRLQDPPCNLKTEKPNAENVLSRLSRTDLPLGTHSGQHTK